MKKQKGITLVALVITIIVLLILAGISIQALTNTGLFEGASQAKKETQRAQVTEWLNLKLIEEQMNKPTGTAEDIIEATRQNVVEHKNELEKIGNPVTVEDTKTEEDGEQVDIYFYVQVDEDVYKVEMAGAKFIGEAGKFPPVIKLESITKTTNSITVQVSTKRNEGGTIEYYIKAEDEKEYGEPVTKEETETTYTYTGLEQNKTYNIKVVAIAANEQTAEVLVDKTLGSVPDLEEGDITFEYSVDGQEINKETWTNKNVTVTVSTEVKGYTLQTSKDGKTWSNLISQTFSENGEIYAVLYDGTNYGGSASGNVTNIDTTKPIVTGATATTNSIAITATDEASGIVGYAVTESSTEPSASSFTSVTSTTSFSTTVTGKTQGTTYYVWVKDAAGNISASKSTATGNVTSLQQGDVIFTFNPSGWTNGSVKVTAALKEGLTSNYTLKITDSDPRGASKATALGWTNGSTGITVSSNKAVYGILVDSEGQIGGATSGNVTNIDTTKPIVTGATATTNSITITATDEASGIVGYAVTESSTEQSASSFTSVTSTTSFSTTVTGKTQGTTYYVWVKDAAGNVSASKSTATGSVTGTITFGKTTWSGGKASTTISTNTSYTIQYQVNSTTGTWKTGTNVTGLVHGDKVYARLWDGTNGGTASAAYNILDGTAPSASISLSSTSTTTAASITATVTHSDSQSGVKIASCKWVYNTTSSAIGTNASSYTGGTFSSNPQTITLSATTAGTYYLHVLTTDVAGNVKETISNAVTIRSPYPTLASKVSVGDYVAYDATNNYSYTSPYGTGPSHGNGSSNQSFTSSSSIKWRVLSTNTSTGEVVLISEAPIGSFTMNGAIGYLYAEQELNNICSIYGHGTGANTSKTFTCKNGDTVEGLSTVTLTGSGARSINVDDINNITGYTPTSGSSYRRYIHYPTKNTTNGISTSTKGRTDVDTCYYYTGSSYISSSSESYKLLFRDEANSSDIRYWLASRCVYAGSDFCSFDVRNVDSGKVDFYYLGDGESSRFVENYYGRGVRPIVYLKSNIQTNGKNSSGAWTIIDK